MEKDDEKSSQGHELATFVRGRNGIRKREGVEELRVDRSSSENVEKNKFKKVLARISRHERYILDTYLMD